MHEVNCIVQACMYVVFKEDKSSVTVMPGQRHVEGLEEFIWRTKQNEEKFVLR